MDVEVTGEEISSFSFSPNGKHMLTGSRRRDSTTGKQRNSLQLFGAYIMDGACKPSMDLDVL